MADNVVANPASGGAVFATDLKGGTENWPISKIGFGARDTDYFIVSEATPLPVSENPSSSSGNAPTSVSVGVTSTSVLASNTSRKGAVFVNLGPGAVSFGIGASAVVSSGITLLPPGGAWTMDAYTFTTQAINAVSTLASTNLSVQEMQ